MSAANGSAQEPHNPDRLRFARSTVRALWLTTAEGKMLVAIYSDERTPVIPDDLTAEERQLLVLALMRGVV